MKLHVDKINSYSSIRLCYKSDFLFLIFIDVYSWNLHLPVSVVIALLGALEHCWSQALIVKVRFWLHISGGRAHVPSDVELHSNIWTSPWLSITMTTYFSAPADSLYITQAEFVRQSISTSDRRGTQGTGSKQEQVRESVIFIKHSVL